jgi:hypothetical protein
MERWTLAEIQDALGTDAARARRPCWRFADHRSAAGVHRAGIRSFAANGGTTVDAALGSELIEFAGAHLTDMQTAIPGYRQAYLFPGPL